MTTHQSKIEKLITELCPNGVEWLPLGDIGEFIRGNGLQKKDFVEDGYPAIHYGQIHTRYGLSARKTFAYVSKELFQKLRKAQKNDLLLATTSENDEDVAKPLAWLGNKVAISGDMILFRHEQNVKYLAYFLQTEAFQTKKRKYITGAKVRRVSSNDLAKIPAPIPPLSIQKEIVRILDTFTELTAELTAELAARKKQYSYYLDQLLTFSDDVVAWVPLGEIFNLKNGYTPSKSEKDFWQNGSIPWFRMDDIRQNGQILDDSLQKISKRAVKGGRLFPADSIIIATSATIGEHALITVPYLANQRFTNLSLKEKYVAKLDIKFLFYYCFLLGEWCRKNTTMSSFASVDMDGFRKFKIPIPHPDDPKKSLAEQARIVSILDKFDTLTHSISEGLPREIALRQKQYEYYREKLLNFPQFPSSGGVAGEA